MARSVPPLDEERFWSVAQILREWGTLHPVPDQPVLQLADGSELSPREIVSAMESFSPTSRNAQVIRTLFSVAVHRDEHTFIPEEAESLDAILEDFRRDISLWRRGSRV